MVVPDWKRWVKVVRERKGKAFAQARREFKKFLIQNWPCEISAGLMRSAKFRPLDKSLELAQKSDLMMYKQEIQITKLLEDILV